jgi:hypothetical protein
MARRSYDEAAAEGIAGAMLLIGLVIVVVIALIILALLAELWRIFKEHTVQPPSPTASRILWGALAGLFVLWLIAGLLTTNPATATLGAAVACWSFFVFVVLCELIDWYYRRHEPPVPKHLELADLVSWHTNGSHPSAAQRLEEDEYEPYAVAA